MTILLDKDVEIVDMTLTEKILEMEGSFRGLWQSCEILDNELTKDKWCVTFVYKGKYVETPLEDTIHEVIDFALGKIRQERQGRKDNNDK